jgi:hypothetical protein
LEKEVLRLREREATLTEQNEELSSELRSLKQSLQENSVNFSPAPSNNATTDQSYLTPLSVANLSIGDLDPTASVIVDLTELGKIEPQAGCSTSAALEWPIPFETPAPSLSELSFLENDPSVLNPQAAIDFVFAYVYCSFQVLSIVIAFYLTDLSHRLEKTCLPHIKHRYLEGIPLPGSDVIPDYNIGMGHVFNATISFLNGDWDEHPTTHPFAVPQGDLNEVFQTNLSLDFGCDVTPMQIWANVTRIAGRHFINAAILQALTEEFKKYARCNR